MASASPTPQVPIAPEHTARRSAEALPGDLVHGRLQGTSVPDLLWNLCRRQCTGVLSVTARGIVKKVHLDRGRIVFAASSHPDDRLGELLLREESITLDQLEEAVAKLPGGKPLGAILVEAGHLRPEDVVRGVRSQIQAIVLGLFPLEEGDYHFDEGPLTDRHVVTLGIPTAELLFQGIRGIRGFARVRRAVGSPSTRLRLIPEGRSLLREVESGNGERTLLEALAAGGEAGKRIDVLCREAPLSDHEVYRVLWALRILGVIVEVEGLDSESSGGLVVEGRLERTGFPELLVRLCRAGETGVLNVSRGGVERGFHITGGSCIFATSSSIDDGLVARLLERGTISLQDRDELSRRLLSNRRAGAILREMGLVREDELRAALQRQLSEIVLDTFGWESGEFQFVSGRLPTREEITLERTLEDLVFAGVRRVTSWSRVLEGCGGTGARLALRPDYLAVLDRTEIDRENWFVISSLKQPRTVSEICRLGAVGAFRVCRLLWALRLLGAVCEAE